MVDGGAPQGEDDVREHDVSVFLQQDVLWLLVSVDDAEHA